ncbi:hypothetical protein B0J11DRAFT_582115 [Dendryphion nanum]|uniref:Uncharacterized protein n=1 Tax=Dendryphion nanum TaxID=256645 RepID=A0A9P9IF66_9PLEO|nr:hypothetical protein B0J11DRAFT_582115 [Dendryphion nanum]
MTKYGGPAPPPAYRQSGLRKELRRQEQTPEQTQVQVSDSDLVVPETQLESHHHMPSDQMEAPVSPETAACIAKNKYEPTQAPQPVQTTLFSRPVTFTKNIDQSQSTSSFSFGFIPRSRKPQDRTKDGSVEVPATPATISLIQQRLTETPSTVQVDHSKKKPISCPPTLSVNSATVQAASDGPFVQDATLAPVQSATMHHGGDDPRTKELTKAVGGTKDTIDSPRQIATSQTSPSQPSHMPSVSSEKVRPSVKPVMKNKKGATIVKPRRKWPPRDILFEISAAQMPQITPTYPSLSIVPEAALRIDIAGPTDDFGSTFEASHHDELIVESPDATGNEQLELSPQLEDVTLSRHRPPCTTDNQPHQNGEPVFIPPCNQPSDIPDDDLSPVVLGEVRARHEVPPSQQGTRRIQAISGSPDRGTRRDLRGDEILHTTSSYGHPSKVMKTTHTRNGNHVENHFTSSFSLRELFNILITKAEADQDTMTKAHLAEIQQYHSEIAAHKKVIFTHEIVIKRFEQSDRQLQMQAARHAMTADRMQKFLLGLQSDYEKLKVAAQTHNAHCSTILKDKINEIVAEKASMELEFDRALTSLQKSHRLMRRTLEECHSALAVSESKRKDLLAVMILQKSTLEEEQARRKELECHGMASMRAIQQHLINSTGPLRERLTNIEATMNDTGTKNDRDDHLQECIDLLGTIKQARSVTVSDVRKAEAALQYIYKGIDKQTKILVEAVNDSHLATKLDQAKIQEQLQALRSDIVKYKEVQAQYQICRESNHRLESRLEVETQTTRKLREEIGASSEKAKEDPVQLNRLHQEIRTLKDMIEDLKSDPTDLELEVANLRSCLVQKEDELKIAVSSVEAAEQQRLADAHNLTDWKEFEIAKKEQYERLSKRFNQEKQDLEAECNNKIHKATRERDEMEMTRQHMQTVVNQKQEALKRLQQELADVKLSNEGLRKENNELLSQLKAMQDTLRADSELEIELQSVRKQLECKADVLTIVEGEHASLRQKHLSIHSELMHLKGMVQSYEKDESVHRFNLHQETEKVLNEQREKDHVALQEARNLQALLQEKVQELESRLKQMQTNNEELVANARAVLSHENEVLRSELTALEARDKFHIHELQRSRDGAADELRECNTKYLDEIALLKRRLEQADSAKINAEGKAERAEYEKAEWLKRQEAIAEQKFREKLASLEREHSNARLRRSSNLDPEFNNQRDTIKLVQDGEASSHAQSLSYHTQNNRSRKKVDRRASTLEVVDRHESSMSSPMSNHVASRSTVHGDHSDFSSQVEVHDPVPPEVMGAPDSLNRNNFYVRKNSPEILVPETQDLVPETQEIADLDILFPCFNEKVSKTQDANVLDDHSVSSQLSDLPSEYLELMESKYAGHPSSATGLNSRSPLNDRHREGSVMSATSPLGLRNFNDRPKSQANTGSRLAVHHPKLVPAKDTRQNSMSNESGNGWEQSVSRNTLDYRQQNNHGTRSVYGHGDKRPMPSGSKDAMVSPEVSPQTPNHNQNRAAKYPTSGMTPKRQRAPSKSNTSSFSQKKRRAAGSSNTASSVHDGRHLTPGRGTRSSRGRSNGDRINQRFDVELE